MDSNEIQTVVIRSTTFDTTNRFPKTVRNNFEVCRIMDSSESFEESFVGRTESIICFVCRCPKSVSTRFTRESVDLEDRIITRSLLKGDTTIRKVVCSTYSTCQPRLARVEISSFPL